MHDVVIILLNLLAIPIVLLTIVGVWLYCIYAFKQFKLWCGLKNINYTRKKLRLKKIKEQVRTKNSRKEPFSDRFYRWTNEHYIITGFLASIIVAGLFIVVMVVYESLTSIGCGCCSPRYITSDERVVLAFVGILATFVVIINHAQMSDSSQKLEKRQDEITGKITRVEDLIETQKNNIQETKTKLMKETLRQNLEFIIACQDEKAFNCGKNIVKKYKENKESLFEIEYFDGQNTNTTQAMLAIEKGVYVFKIPQAGITLPLSAKAISKIDRQECSNKHLDILVANLMQLKDIS